MKLQEKDNSRIYKSIEETSKLEELQANIEMKDEKVRKREMEREKMKVEEERLKTKEAQINNLEKEKNLRKNLLSDKRKRFEEIIVEAQRVYDRKKMEVSSNKNIGKYEKI